MSINWNRYSTLEIVEALAEYEGAIASEEELSELFDQELAPYVLDQYGEDDVSAFSEAFNDWTDALRSNGELHPEQYNNYGYVGRYS